MASHDFSIRLMTEEQFEALNARYVSKNPILNFRLLSTDKIQHQTPCLSTKKIHFLMKRW